MTLKSTGWCLFFCCCLLLTGCASNDDSEDVMTAENFATQNIHAWTFTHFDIDRPAEERAQLLKRLGLRKAGLVDLLRIDPKEENKAPVDLDFVPQDYTFSRFNKFVDRDGYPAVKAPWGVLSALNLNRGEIVWQTPICEYEEITQGGIPVAGIRLFGDSTVTAGGLVLFRGSTDRSARVKAS